MLIQLFCAMATNYARFLATAFAFGLYGAWLVSAINSDFEGGYRMGRLAVNLMNRLEAKEVRLQCTSLPHKNPRKVSSLVPSTLLAVSSSCVYIRICIH